MSLVTDKFFAKALRESVELNELVEGRIFNTVDDEIDPDSAAIPSVFIFNLGTQNDQGTKDNGCESDTDHDNIMLGISAKKREELGQIATLVRSVVRDAVADLEKEDWQSLSFYIDGYTFTASGVTWDQLKPCFWQELNYACETINIE